MNLNDYIHGARNGRAAHDLELEAMHDPLLADALDGFDAVAGDHTAALERIAARVGDSASGGRASARARASRLHERRTRGWSVAAAAVFLAGVVGGAAWLMQDDASTDGPVAPARPGFGRGGSTLEIEPTLPPVIVIPNDSVSPETPPSDISGVKLNPDEVRPAPDVPDASVADSLRTDTIRIYKP
jgi:hypothetical protein